MEHVRLDLIPQMRARCPAGNHQRAFDGVGMLPHARHDLVQTEHHTFEHRPRQVPRRMSRPKSDEGSRGFWIPDGRALAFEVGEKQQPIRTRWHRRRPGQQVIGIAAHRLCQPSQRTSSTRRHTIEQILPRKKWRGNQFRRAVLPCGHDAEVLARACDVEGVSFTDHPATQHGGVEVVPSAHDRQAAPEAGFGRGAFR